MSDPIDLIENKPEAVHEENLLVERQDLFADEPDAQVEEIQEDQFNLLIGPTMRQQAEEKMLDDILHKFKKYAASEEEK